MLSVCVRAVLVAALVAARRLRRQLLDVGRGDRACRFGRWRGGARARAGLLRHRPVRVGEHSTWYLAPCHAPWGGRGAVPASPPFGQRRAQALHWHARGGGAGPNKRANSPWRADSVFVGSTFCPPTVSELKTLRLHAQRVRRNTTQLRHLLALVSPFSRPTFAADPQMPRPRLALGMAVRGMALAGCLALAWGAKSHGRPGAGAGGGGGGVVTLTGASLRRRQAPGGMPPRAWQRAGAGQPRRLRRRWLFEPLPLLERTCPPPAADLNFDANLANGKPWMINIFSHYVRSRGRSRQPLRTVCPCPLCTAAAAERPGSCAVQCQLTHEMEDAFEKIVHQLHPDVSVGRVSAPCSALRLRVARCTAQPRSPTAHPVSLASPPADRRHHRAGPAEPLPATWLPRCVSRQRYRDAAVLRGPRLRGAAPVAQAGARGACTASVAPCTRVPAQGLRPPCHPHASSLLACS